MNLDPYTKLRSLAYANHWPAWELEYRFHPVRRWRFDIAWPQYKIAVEIEGVVYGSAGGRHQRAKGLEADCEKYNVAVLSGWLLLRFTPHQIKSETDMVEGAINTALKSRREKRYL